LINNRQAGRRRGRNNNPRQNGGGGGGNRGNGDSGNRIDNRARGNAAQLLEKYRNLARDAQMAGDRVNAEYYFQFADHYFRVLADNRSRQEEHQQRFRRNDEGDQDGGDDADDMIDTGDESDEFAPQPQKQYEQRPRRDRDNNRDRDNGRDRDSSRGRGERADRGERGNDRGGNDRGANDRDRGERGQDRQQQNFANDDSDADGDIGLPGLPPSIGRIEVDDEPARNAAPEEVVEVAPKPRRGRRPRQPEAAE
jgi:hypothetical protein